MKDHKQATRGSRKKFKMLLEARVEAAGPFHKRGRAVPAAINVGAAVSGVEHCGHLLPQPRCADHRTRKKGCLVSQVVRRSGGKLTAAKAPGRDDTRPGQPSASNDHAADPTG